MLIGTASASIAVSVAVAVVALFAVLTVAGRRKGFSGLGGNTVVRCRRGHLFTTIWVPGASFKAVRLGWLRFQRCPVGKHWSLVRPVDVSTLSEEERQRAAANKDVRLP